MVLNNSNTTYRFIKLLLLPLAIFTNSGCKTQQNLTRLILVNDGLHATLTKVISEENRYKNVILLNVKDVRDSVFISLITIDSSSVSQYLDKSIHKVVGALQYQDRIVLILGNRNLFFKSAATSIKINFLKKAVRNNQLPPVPLDVFPRNYVLQNDGRLTLLNRTMGFFGK